MIAGGLHALLSEAVSVIGKHDFPRAWPNLLPKLVNSLDRLSKSFDYASVNVVLAMLNSLFKKFRYGFMNNDLMLDLKYCLDNFAKPLLLLFQRTASLIDQGDAGSLKLYIESQKLCCRLFYSFNFQDLPEFFEDHCSEWMTEFGKYLTFRYPALEDAGVDGLALVDSLRSAVCKNIRLDMERDEEEDLLKEIKDPKQFLLVSLSKTFAASPGVYASIISKNLDEANRASLLQLCNYH